MRFCIAVSNQYDGRCAVHAFHTGAGDLDRCSSPIVPTKGDLGALRIKRQDGTLEMAARADTNDWHTLLSALTDAREFVFRLGANDGIHQSFATFDNLDAKLKVQHADNARHSQFFHPSPMTSRPSRE